jgi:signal transduction histidine kinase
MLALVVTSLATLGAAALVVVPPLERRLEHDRLHELHDLAVAVRPALRAIPVGERHRGSPALLRVAERLQRRTGGGIAVYDGSGTALADVGPVPVPGRPLSAVVGAQRALPSARRDAVVTGERGGMAFAVTVAGGPRARLTLLIAERLDDTRAAASVVRAALPLALAAGLAVAVILALLVSRGLLRRLRRLEADALALSAQGLDHPVSTTGRDEVAVVARALEAMRERLVEEQASRQRFVATASHELRTPLASLQATLELLKEQAGHGAADRRAVAARADTALRQTHRLVGLAGELLELSRVDGDAPLELEPIELGELARTIAREFAARLQAGGRALRVDGGPAVACADPAAAARILRVLLDNAASYGAGTIGVTVSRASASVLVAVEDDGPGVAPDEREQVFGRFARGRAAANAGPGAGLGLAIARGLARAMGGDVEAAPVRRGARFVLTLCAAEEVVTDSERGVQVR